MKELLKSKFNEVFWSETFSMRQEDLKKTVPAVVIQSQWPGLFTVEGVILILRPVIQIIYSSLNVIMKCAKINQEAISGCCFRG